MDDMKYMMDHIVEHGDKAAMDYLGEVFLDMAEDMKEDDPTEYKDLIYNMQMKALDGHLTKDQAKCWTYKMKNKDGTKGEHWTYEQTESVRQQYASECNACDFYAVLNMMYSDYYSNSFDTRQYIEMAKDFLNDPDAPKGKVLKYYLFVFSE